jgi:DNA-binding response OmpR family regulator
MRAIVLSSDLMVASTAQGAADRHGFDLTVAPTADGAVNSAQDAAIVAIDLRTPGLDLVALMPRLRDAAQRGAPIVAFGPHVHTDALSAAAAAGCDEVITRGQFERRFDALLAALTAPAAKDRR